MHRRNENLILSPSDLNNFLECKHLTGLDLAVTHAEVAQQRFVVWPGDLRSGEDEEN